MIKEKAIKWLDDHEERMIEISINIWEFAELGLIEYKSSALLAGELEKHGFKVEKGVANMPTAFVTTWGSGGPVIGVIGEYDALPGLSQKVVTRKEPLKIGEPGHGCGHNIYGASGLAGALAIRHALENAGLEGTVKFFGTPAEESASGKVWMVRAGVFDGVDTVLGHHPSIMNMASLATSLANNSVNFHFHGRTSHAAGSPEQGRSALDAVELMNIGVNYLREHIIQDARIHYVVTHGGEQPNTVPDYARSWYLIRAPERDQVDHIYKRVLKIAEGAALMTGTRLEIDFIKGVYNNIPNKTLSDIVISNMGNIGAPKYTAEEIEWAERLVSEINRQDKIEMLRKTSRPDWRSLKDVVMDRSIPEPWDEGDIKHGSTDIGDVSWKAPTLEFNTATWPIVTPGHSWMNVAGSAYSTGHKSLIFAAKVIATSGLDLILNPKLVKKTWKEFRDRLNGYEYKSPLPKEAEPPLEMWENE